MCLLNNTYRCTQPEYMYKLRFPRAPLDAVKFQILEPINTSELDILITSPMIISDEETSTIWDLCEYTKVHSLNNIPGEGAKFFLERRRSYDKSNVQQSNG